MWINYLKIAFRNLSRHKVYSFLNILGLSVGIASCLLIVMFIQEELSYDQFHEKKDSIFLVTETTHFGDEDALISRTPYPLAPIFQSQISGIKSFVRIDNIINRKQYVSYQDKNLEVADPETLAFVDSTFFDVFSFEVISGDPSGLAHPYKMLISDKKAKAYFGQENPIGKVMAFTDIFNAGTFEAEVIGVYSDMPQNSHLKKDFLISLATADREMPFRLDNWNIATQYTYFLLDEGVQPELLKESMAQVTKTSTPEYAQRYYSFSLFPLKDLYLKSNFDKSFFPVGDLQWVYIFGVIALFIIIIACINYINLATARGGVRAQEVGLRKVVGADRKQLISQFLSESILIVLISLIIGLLIVGVSLPFFNQLTGKTFTLDFLNNFGFISALVGIILLIGLGAGSYPAFYLSAFSPSKVLKGEKIRISWRALIMRKGLVVFQFTASIVLIIGTLIIYDQWDYLRNKKLGIETDQVITLPIQSSQFVDNYQSFKSELLKNSTIKSVSASNKSITQRFFDFAQVSVNQEEEQKIVAFGAVDFDFFETFEIQFLEGRPFQREISTDSEQAIILNESAQKLFGLADPLGNTLKVGSEGTPMQVIGVVQDFHFEDLHNKVQPMVFFITSNYLNQVSVRVAGGNLTEAISQIENNWNEFQFKEPFTYSILNEEIAQLYQQEASFLRVFSVFAALSIFISCLGSFGLLSFSITQRTKEIGIRKVLGASISQVVLMLSVDFTALIFVALVIASPIAYFIMKQWLANFAYQIAIEWWVFGLSGFLAIVIALGTISLQAINAALMNPVKSLKNE